ncbi:MAG: cysteine desulfurase family protein [Candidatus Micrarchaeia archaeon]
MDNSATTCVLPDVVREMLPYYTKKYGNPSSLHYLGEEAENAITKARTTIAKAINASASEIIFTGSATEANNIAIYGIALAGKKNGKTHLITSAIEHSAALNPMKRLEKQGFELTILPVDSEGFIDTTRLENAINEKTALVSIIHANHEIGTIQNLREIGKICREKGVPFHTDSAQGFTKTELDVKAQNIDMVTLNSHKIHGPKGVGALYIRSGIKLEKVFDGGPQEFDIRPGTENVPAIVGFAKAVEIGMRDYEQNTAHMRSLRNMLIDGLLSIENTHLNGPKGKNMDKRLPNNANITFKYIEGEAIVLSLSMHGICVSTGSACSSHALQPSHILTAIGLRHEDAHGSIRYSLSRFNTKEEVEYVIEKTRAVVEKLRKISAFVPQ